VKAGEKVRYIIKVSKNPFSTLFIYFSNKYIGVLGFWGIGCASCAGGTTLGVAVGKRSFRPAFIFNQATAD